MSVNPIIAPVDKPSWIEFEYLDEKGKMYNRVFQHEIDHMDGIINIDLVKSKELNFESDPSYYEKARFEEV